MPHHPAYTTSLFLSIVGQGLHAPPLLHCYKLLLSLSLLDSVCVCVCAFPTLIFFALPAPYLPPLPATLPFLLPSSLPACLPPTCLPPLPLPPPLPTTLPPILPLSFCLYLPYLASCPSTCSACHMCCMLYIQIVADCSFYRAAGVEGGGTRRNGQGRWDKGWDGWAGRGRRNMT